MVDTKQRSKREKPSRMSNIFIAFSVPGDLHFVPHGCRLYHRLCTRGLIFSCHVSLHVVVPSPYGYTLSSAVQPCTQRHQTANRLTLQHCHLYFFLSCNSLLFYFLFLSLPLAVRSLDFLHFLESSVRSRLRIGWTREGQSVSVM